MKKTWIALLGMAMIVPGVLVFPQSEGQTSSGEDPASFGVIKGTPVRFYPIPSTTVLYFRSVTSLGSEVNWLDTLPPLTFLPGTATPQNPTGNLSPRDFNPNGRTQTFTVLPSTGLPNSPSSSIASFPSAPLRHAVNISRLDAFLLEWWAEPPAPSAAHPLVWEYRVFSAGLPQPVAEGSFVDQGGGEGVRHYSVEVPRTTRGIVTLPANQPLRVEILLRDPAVTTLPVNPTTWTLHYAGQNVPSSLTVRSDNAFKVASFLTDPNLRVTTSFRATSQGPNRALPWFALMDAFQSAPEAGPTVQSEGPVESTTTAGADLSCTDLGDILNPRCPHVRVLPSPLLQIVRKGSPIALGSSPDSPRVFSMKINSSLGGFPAGLLVWTPDPAGPTPYWDFSTAEGGEYVLRASLSGIRSDDELHPMQILSLQAPDFSFTVSRASFEVAPFEGDTLNHEVVPGSSTTFAVGIRNNASSPDQIEVNVTQITAQGSWTTSLSGPTLLGSNRILVGPGETQPFFVRVRPPEGSSVGESAAFRLTAESTTDRTQKRELIFVVTLSTSVRRDISLIVPNPVTNVTPGGTVNVSLLVWNRGTSPQNLTLRTSFDPVANWNVTLVQEGLPVPRAVLRSVEPGEARPVLLRATAGPLTPVGDRLTVTLNASFLDGTGPFALRSVTLQALGTATFFATVLNGISGQDRHILEMWCPVATTTGQSPTQAGGIAEGRVRCPAGTPPFVNPNVFPVSPSQPNAQPDLKDYVNASWWRVWIHNSGTTDDTYSIRIGSVNFELNPGEQGFPAPDPDPANATQSLNPWGDPVLYLKRTDGTLVNLLSEAEGKIRVPAKSVGEFYVYAPFVPDQAHRRILGITGLLLIQSEVTKVTLPYTFKAYATDQRLQSSTNPRPEDQARFSGVLLEPVERAPRLSGSTLLPLVDLKGFDPNLPPKVQRSFIDVNGSVTFRARVTNGASWGSFVDRQNVFHTPNVTLSLSGVRTDLGWKVLLRFNDGRQDGKCGGPAPRQNPFVPTLTFTNVNPQTGQREVFRDAEVEVCVLPPSGQFRPRAGDRLNFQLVATQENPAGGLVSSVLTYEVEITDLAILTLFPLCGLDMNSVSCTSPKAPASLPIEPGRSTSYVLYVANNGSASADIQVNATLEEPSGALDLWSVTPRQVAALLRPGENRSFGFTLSAPTTARPGDLPARVKVCVSFTPRSTSANSTTLSRCTYFHAEIRQGGILSLTANPSSITLTPGGQATILLNVTNRDPSIARTVGLRATAAQNFSSTLFREEQLVDVPASSTRQVPMIVAAPSSDIFAGQSFDVLVQARDARNPNPNAFATTLVRLNVAGGRAIPSVSAETLESIVDRSSFTTFRIKVENRGAVRGTFPLEVTVGTVPGSDPFVATIQDERGRTIGSLELDAGAVAFLLVNVSAPRHVPEGAILPVTVRVLSPDRSLSSEATMRVKIHDYGIDLRIVPSDVTVLPGLPAFFTVRVTNAGNGPDRLNFTADLTNLPGWTAEFSVDQISLEPGSTASVQMTLRSPRGQLPPARKYSIAVFSYSQGAAAVGLEKLSAAPVALTVLEYRPIDVDGDGYPEIFVDFDRSTTTGFEEFREVDTRGVQTQLVAKLHVGAGSRTQFLLEAPSVGGYRGIANLFVDPDRLYVFRIRFTGDLDGDSIPDYLLDLDGNNQEEKLYNLATRRLTNVVGKDFLGNGRIQFLADLDGDGRYDVYFDPDSGVVTKVTRESRLGTDVYGLDTTRSGHPTLFYDAAADRVFNARVLTLADLALQYWFVVVALVAALVVFLVVYLRRGRAPPPKQEGEVIEPPT